MAIGGVLVDVVFVVGIRVLFLFLAVFRVTSEETAPLSVLVPLSSFAAEVWWTTSVVSREVAVDDGSTVEDSVLAEASNVVVDLGSGTEVVVGGFSTLILIVVFIVVVYSESVSSTLVALDWSWSLEDDALAFVSVLEICTECCMVVPDNGVLVEGGRAVLGGGFVVVTNNALETFKVGFDEFMGRSGVLVFLDVDSCFLAIVALAINTIVL